MGYPGAEQGITIEEAVYAYTMGAAYQIRAEEFIGSLELGKRSDLVVVDQNLFEIDPSQVHNTKAVLTMLNGDVVYRRDDEDRY
jgi:predicted amidohydrolase YtcJ